MIKQLIERDGPSFGVLDVHCPEHLARVCRSAYVDTALPGSLCLAVGEKYFHIAACNPNIAAIVATPGAPAPWNTPDKTVVVARHAEELFYFLHNQAVHQNGFHDASSAVPTIASTARVAASASIGDRVVIEDDVEIGERCVIAADTVIGAGTAVHPGAMIGMAGSFGKMIRGKKEHLRQFGGTRIGRGCVLLAGSVVVRAVNVGEYTELGDQVYLGIGASVGHDCRIGSGTDVSAKATIAGRVRVGSGCWIGAGAIISNGLKVGDGASIRIGAVVIAHVPAGSEVSGNFALDHRRHLRNFVQSKS